MSTLGRMLGTETDGLSVDMGGMHTVLPESSTAAALVRNMSMSEPCIGELGTRLSVGGSGLAVTGVSMGK